MIMKTQFKITHAYTSQVDGLECLTLGSRMHFDFHKFHDSYYLSQIAGLSPVLHDMVGFGNSSNCILDPLQPKML